MPDAIITGVWQLHLAATLYMVGVIWFVQVVHYPLLAFVGRVEAAIYQQAHTRRTTWVVGPPMIIELASGILLLWVRPEGISLTQVIGSLTFLAVIWLSTLFVQIPCHDQLSKAFTPFIHRRLVLTNWVRTIGWSLRALLLMI